MELEANKPIIFTCESCNGVFEACVCVSWVKKVEKEHNYKYNIDSLCFECKAKQEKEIK